MAATGEGPPKEAGPHRQRRGHAEDSNTNTSTAESSGIGAREPGKALLHVPCTRSYPQDLHAQLHRRRAASRRLPRCCDRCGARDPLLCRCWEPKPPLSDNAIDAWRATIERTMPIGAPIVPIEVLQRFHRNGGADRELAEVVWAQTGGLIV